MPMTTIHFNNIIQQYDKTSIKPSSNPLFFESNCFLPDNDLNGNKLLQLFDTPTIRMTNALIDENIILLTVLNIIRNLSFELTNELFMATSTSIIQHLVYIMITGKRDSELSKVAGDTLILLAPRIDFCNRKRPSNNLSNFSAIENMSVESIKKGALTSLKLSRQYSHQSIVEYNMALMVLLAYTYQSILIGADRQILLKSMELLSKLVMINDNAPIISRISDEMLEMLTELLCVTTTSLEQLYTDSVTNIFHKQPACFNSASNYVYDDEIRDYAVDILYGYSLTHSLMLTHSCLLTHAYSLMLTHSFTQYMSKWIRRDARPSRERPSPAPYIIQNHRHPPRQVHHQERRTHQEV